MHLFVNVFRPATDNPAQVVMSVTPYGKDKLPDWELDEVPAIGDPPQMIQIGTNHVFTFEGQRWMAAQGLVGAAS